MDDEAVVAKLHPQLRHFLVSRLGWRDLRPVQVRAYKDILHGRNVLLCAPTASGKTEAAFIPLFDRLLRKKALPLFALYISPLKALIDDCYERLLPWQHDLGIEIAVRHGDRQTDLKRLCEHPPHVLMITPESLEVVLAYRTAQERRSLLRNLETVVVDEVHNLVPTHRGAQLSSLLVRVRPYVKGGRLQLVGLSATVGDPEGALAWLAGAEGGSVIAVPSDRDMHFSVCFGGDIDDAQVATKAVVESAKALVFVPSRALAESLGNRLRTAVGRLGASVVHVHHSSLDGRVKEEHQEQFKQRARGIMVATSTLELGIDIGDLDLIIHYHPPQSADSFAQRSGRAGRRQTPAQVVVVAYSTTEVLVSAALISLAARGEVEPHQPLTLAYDVLLQQLLCLILEHRAVPRRQVWDTLLCRAFGFAGVTETEFEVLLDYWAAKELIEVGAGGQISFGRLTELEFGKRNYVELLSSIPFAREFAVVSASNKRAIGSLDVRFALTLEPGDEFLLAGEAWRVQCVRAEEARVLVLPGGAEQAPRWSSGIGGLSALVARECWRIMTGGLPKPVRRALSPVAVARIQELQHICAEIGLAEDVLAASFDPDENRWWILTFAGHAANALLRDLLRQYAGGYDARINGFSVGIKLPERLPAVWNDLVGRLRVLQRDQLGQLVREPRPLTTFGRFLPPEYLGLSNAEIQYDLHGALQRVDEGHLREYHGAGIARLSAALGT